MNDLGKVRAPALPTEGAWLNCQNSAALVDGLPGRVHVLDFWTYCCINCMHVMPVLSRLEQRFALAPVQVVGVHTPKFLQERDEQNVRRAIARHHVQHPVLLDEGQTLWSKYTVKAWPTLVLVDAEGYVREHLQGEAEEEDLARRIEALLDEGREKGILAEGPIDHHGMATEDTRELFFPGKVAASEDRLFVADSGHHRILECDHEGRVLRVLGTGLPGRDDGRFDACSFREPQGMTLQNGHLYVADRANHLLRRVDLDLGWVKTVAGHGSIGTHAGPVDPEKPLEIGLRSPWDLVAVGGHLVVAMAGSHQLWLYDTEKEQVGAWAGSGVEDHVDASLQEAAFAQPSGLCLAGPWVMVADSEVSSVRAVSLEEGQVQTVVGHGLFDYGDVDGEGEKVLLQHCMDVARIGETLYVADTYNNKIKAIDLRTRHTTTVFGNGHPEVLYEPAGLCAVGERLLVADTNNHRLLWADPADQSLTPLVLSGLDEV